MKYLHPLFTASYQLNKTPSGGLNSLFAIPLTVAHGLPVVACPAVEIGEKVGFRSMFWS
jgi:hypothetical protein